MKINIHEAKNNFSQLIERALRGEEIIVARHGKALIRFVPVEQQAALRPVGLHRVEMSEERTEHFVAESLRSLDENDLAEWERPL